ncbi:MAG: YigZ family protein [Pseudoruegeria sp.]
MNPDLIQFEGFLTDKGSKYAVSGAKVSNRIEANAVLKALTRKKKYAKATHNTWAVLMTSDGQHTPLKNDDGESGAGMVILRMLEREELYNHMIIVTRWYGGTKLGGDRFRHVQTSVRHYLDNVDLTDA